MKTSIDGRHAYCERRGTGVSLEQTEGQCRDRHNCGDERCPLENELGRPRFGQALDLLAASFGQALDGGFRPRG